MSLKSARNFTLLSIVCITLFSACASSSYSIREPHVYNNTFQETIDGVKQALQLAHMKAQEAKFLDNGDYYVRYLQSRYDLPERNEGAAFTADITIKKLDDYRTEVKIVEEEQSNFVPGEFKKKLAKDVYRQLNDILDLKPKNEATAQ